MYELVRQNDIDGYKNQSEKQSESDVPNSGFFLCSHFLSRSFINFDVIALLPLHQNVFDSTVRII
jgi:hypothetical protein